MKDCPYFGQVIPVSETRSLETELPENVERTNAYANTALLRLLIAAASA
jgi:hypothetical protein